MLNSINQSQNSCNKHNLLKQSITCVIWIVNLLLTGNQLLADSCNNSDSLTVQRLIKIVVESTGVDNIKALENANKAILLAKKINYSDGTAEAYYKRAILYYYMSDYKKAEADLDTTLEYRIKTGDEKGIADVYQMQGIILDAYYQHDKAIEIYYKAIEKYAKINDKDGLSAAYGNIAISYTILNDFDNSIKYQRKSLNLASELKDYESVAISYYEIAVCYEKMNLPDKALMFLDSAEYFHNIAGKLSGKAAVYNSKGVVYKKKKHYDKALNYFNEAVKINTKLGLKQELSLNMQNIGELYLLLGNSDNAIHYLNQALKIAIDINNYEVIIASYKFLSKAYKQKGQFDKALEFYEKYDELKDTSSIEEAKNKMLMLQAYYNDKQKENEITILNQKNKIKEIQIKKQNYLLFFSIIIVTFLSVLIYLWYKKYKEKNRLNTLLKEQNQKIQSQKDEIEKQKHNIEIQAQQLKELNEYKSKFYENISHEFRTPLTLILSPLEQLIKSNSDKNTVELYQIMYRNARHLHNNINHLLQMAKLEKKEIKINWQRTDIKNLLNGIVNSFEYEALQKSVSLEFIDNKCDFAADVDVEKMESIIINIISNAIKYAPSKGKVKVELNKANEHFSVTVFDNGPGINQEDLPYIFDRFYKTNDDKPGFGLGLSIVKEYVELFNGTISVKSEPGMGTEFTLKFPINNKNEKIINLHKTEQNNNNADLSSESSEKYVVLIVEDNEDMLTYLINQLNHYFEVLTAKNGKEALEVTRNKFPDCIVSDIMMPVMDGYEMTRILKNDIIISHIPVILLTAKTSESSIIHGMEVDADSYLTKPFKIKELIARINSIIRNRNKLKEKFSRNININLSEISVTSIDEKFLVNAVKIIEENISITDFDVNDFCRQMGISRANMHRKIKAITNMTTTEFIRTIRLKKAAQLIEKNAGTISEIAYMVGFDNLSYFTRCFKELFNVSPSEYKSRK